MNLTIFKVNTAVMSEATGLSIQACQLLIELQPSCITTAEIEPIELLHELQDNGLIETSEGMNATLSQAGRELIKDFQLEEKIMSKNSNGFNNFAVLTAEVSDIEVKEARNGKKYKVGKATLLGLTYTGEDGQEYYPVIDVLVFNGAKKHLKPGKVKIVGNLSYAEWEDGDGDKHSQLKVIANYVEAASEDERAKAFCKLTLRVGKDGESRLSSKTGNPWASVRASLSMGKDEDGQYRPSLWLTLKAFTHNGNEDFVYSVADLAQGEYIDVSGGLSCDEYKGRLNWGLFLNNNGFVYHDFDSAGDADGAEEEAIEEAEELEELEAIPD